MTTQANADVGKLLLRAVLAVLLLFHGVDKLLHGTSGIEGLVQGAGLPAFLAYGVYLGEIVGPVMLLAGWYARVGAGLIAVNMVVAFVLVHSGQLFQLADTGGWALELQAMYLVGGVALVLLGPGRYSLDRL